MINLIPNLEKKTKIKDFYFRLVVVFFVVFGFCVLLGAVAILPSYFLSSIKKNQSLAKLETQKSQPVPQVDASTEATIADLNSKLNLIDKAEGSRYDVSLKVINEIILHKMSDIKISQIDYENVTLTGKKIIVRGIAPSRERLLLFRQALEDDVAFKKVDLPISNFVKGSNIVFSLSLTPL